VLAAVSVTVAIAYAPTTAHAAVCADYPNQAAAQQAADTRDADGDGIYCESLPCPCSKGSGGSEPSTPSTPAPARSSNEQQRRKLERPLWRITSTVDGDTIKVKRTDAPVYETIRLIGIDTPETHKPGVKVECGGPEASAKMRRMAFTADHRGRRVHLKTDRTQDVRDRYGRALAYVITLAGRDLNRAQVQAGLALPYIYNGNPFQRFSAYDQSKRQAKKANRGSWKHCGGNFHSEQS